MKPPAAFRPGARERFLSVLRRVYPRELGAEVAAAAAASVTQCDRCLWPLLGDATQEHACNVLQQRTLAYLISPKDRQMALLKLAMNCEPYSREDGACLGGDGVVDWRSLLESRSAIASASTPEQSRSLSLSLSGLLTFPLTLAAAIAALPPGVATGDAKTPLRVAVVGARAEAGPEMDVLWEEVAKALPALARAEEENGGGRGKETATATATAAAAAAAATSNPSPSSANASAASRATSAGLDLTLVGPGVKSARQSPGPLLLASLGGGDVDGEEGFGSPRVSIKRISGLFHEHYCCDGEDKIGGEEKRKAGEEAGEEEEEEEEEKERAFDVAILFNPGIGEPGWGKSWEPTLRALLGTCRGRRGGGEGGGGGGGGAGRGAGKRKEEVPPAAVILTALSPGDASADEAFVSALSEADVEYEENRFASLLADPRSVRELEEDALQRSNWAVATVINQ